jgi:hypothetical protein
MEGGSFIMGKLEKVGDDGFLFEMANLHKSESRLPVNIYFTCNGDSEITNHNALRIKVQRNRGEKVDPKNLAPLVFHTTPGYETITDIKWVGRAPKESEISKSDLNRIIRYVKKHWGIIVKHWCGEITDRELLLTLPQENIN